MIDEPILILCSTDETGTPDWIVELLEKKWIACATKIPQCESHYWWNDKIETAIEQLWLLKSLQSHNTLLLDWIKSRHPYSTPEILVIPIHSISEKYLQWMSTIISKT